MLTWNQSKLTNKGKALLAKAQAGKCTIQITKTQTGSGSYETGESTDAMTALKDKKQEFAVSSKTISDETTLVLGVAITNKTSTEELAAGYEITEFGVFATDPDDGEILYSIATTEKSDYMPAYDGNIPYVIKMKYFLNVSNSAEVTVVSAGAFAFASDVELLSERIDAMETTVKSFTGRCKLKLTFASEFTGSAYSVKSSDASEASIGGTVPSDLSATVIVLGESRTYTVSATAGGITYDTDVATSQYYGVYAAEINAFKATVAVSTDTGASISVSDGTHSYSGTASSESLDIVVGYAGTYTIAETLNGEVVCTESVTVTDNGGNYPVTVKQFTAYIAITTKAGATVDVTGAETHTAAATLGSYTFKVHTAGTYSCSASLDGKTTSAKTVSVTTSGTTYSVECLFTVVYTVVMDFSVSTPASMCTYADDAAGMSSGHAAWKDKEIFKNIKSCLLNSSGTRLGYLNEDNVAKYTDGTAAPITTVGNDVMIEYPEVLGYKFSLSGTKLTVSVTNELNKSGYSYDAFSYAGTADASALYIGRYLGYQTGSKMYSVSGQTPTASVTIGTCRTAARARGTGYEQIGFAQLKLRQALDIIKFANGNMQDAVGWGYVGGSAKTVTGGGNAYGADSEVIKASNPSYLTDKVHQVVCNGMEDEWGNAYQWIDGVVTDASYNILTAKKASDFNDSGSNYTSHNVGITAALSGYINGVQGTNDLGLIVKSAGGSDSTYLCDYGYVGPGYLPVAGGAYGSGSDAGPFYFYLGYSASSSGASVAGRLMFLKV